MTRHVIGSPVLALACSLTAAGVAWSQGAAKVDIEPYTGPPIYLEENTESVPASVVGSTVQKDEYENGNLKIERGLTKYSDNSLVSNGVYREFYRDGQQFVEGQYADGDPTGEWTYWHPTGEVAKKVTYKQGQPDGAVEMHRADGTLDARRSYVNGKRDGAWETFAEDGQTRLTEHTYEAGKPTGVWKWWYKNGQLQRETHLKDGQRHGLAVEWAEDGSKRAEVNFRDGKRHGLARQWLPDGRQIEQNYEDGKPVNN